MKLEPPQPLTYHTTGSKFGVSEIQIVHTILIKILIHYKLTAVGVPLKTKGQWTTVLSQYKDPDQYESITSLRIIPQRTQTIDTTIELEYCGPDL